VPIGVPVMSRHDILGIGRTARQRPTLLRHRDTAEPTGRSTWRGSSFGKAGSWLSASDHVNHGEADSIPLADRE
jgi:hypothetical protein